MLEPMQIPLQLTVRGMEHSPAVDDRVREHVDALERFHPRITACRVVVTESHKHQQQGRHFEVRLDVRVPGHAEIVVNRQHDEDVYVAMRDAFQAAGRQLEEVARVKRGDVKSHGR
ncbi:MAG TPA: HPF/RaiA family ribosome-associated protein [Casimicrobiaceae bacterium]